jgi:Tfp pilus assembly protein PilO
MQLRMQIDKPITSALLIFLVVVLSFFFVVPKYKEFKAHQLILGEKEAEYNAKYNYYAQVSEVYEELQSRTENLKKIEDALPANSALGDLVYFFSQKSFENGLVAKDLYLMKISAINPESDIKEITFSMDLIGSYAAFKNFLYGLE